MQKVMIILAGLIALAVMGGYKYYEHTHPVLPPAMVADDPHPDENRPVHVKIGAHDYVFPRYYIQNYPGENVHLENVSAGEGKYQLSRLAEIDLIASLPDFKPVTSADRDDPFGGHVDNIVRIAIVDRKPDNPETLKHLAETLQSKNIAFTLVKGPYGLTQEDDPTMAGKVPGHHMFGMLYGRELMITCQQAPGLRCSFDYPLVDQTVTVSFSTQQLQNWSSIYVKAVQFVTAFRKN
jgi:hypothetical protein